MYRKSVTVPVILRVKKRYTDSPPLPMTPPLGAVARGLVIHLASDNRRTVAAGIGVTTVQSTTGVSFSFFLLQDSCPWNADWRYL